MLILSVLFMYFRRNNTYAQNMKIKGRRKEKTTQQKADEIANCYIICYSFTRKILRTADNFVFNIAIANDGYSKDKLTHLIRDFTQHFIDHLKRASEHPFIIANFIMGFLKGKTRLRVTKHFNFKRMRKLFRDGYYQIMNYVT